MNILVTGCAGFIGYHISQVLISQGHQVYGIDSINDYYDVRLKIDRLRLLGVNEGSIGKSEVVVSSHNKNFVFRRLDLVDENSLSDIFNFGNFDIVCHLAAQAGVRYSIDNPRSYVSSNLLGFFNVIENCRRHRVKHFVYASSSSVYGNSSKNIFSEGDFVDKPISLYAATKKSNELVAYSYSHLYGLQTTGLRFFTVYGPWGRPDMAYFTFVKNILNNIPIEVYGEGQLMRDFTYIDDIISGLAKVINSNRKTIYDIYNIGRGKPVSVNDLIEAVEAALESKASIQYLPLQPGDVQSTYADISHISRDYNYLPVTDIKDGIVEFTKWYKSYYGV